MALPYSLVLSFENFENHLNLNILVKYFLVLKNYLLEGTSSKFYI